MVIQTTGRTESFNTHTHTSTFTIRVISWNHSPFSQRQMKIIEKVPALVTRGRANDCGGADNSTETSCSCLPRRQNTLTYSTPRGTRPDRAPVHDRPGDSDKEMNDGRGERKRKRREREREGEKKAKRRKRFGYVCEREIKCSTLASFQSSRCSFGFTFPFHTY